jgi:DNA-damage-inducible protein J
MTTTVHAEVDEVVKAKAEAVLATAGLDLSHVIRLMLILIASGKASPIDLLIAAKKEGVLTPNAETIEAIEAARRGELSGPFGSVDELMTHLHADD